MGATGTLRELLILLLILRIQSSDDESGYRYKVDVRKVDFHARKRIFYLLKDLGENQRPPDKKNAKQFTCTVVLSEQNLPDTEQWFDNRAFPDFITKNERRVKVQYNENGTNTHGEKIILEDFLDSLINNMQDDSKKEGHNEYPIVFMYSYNIPCSLIDHKCAELLANETRKRLKTSREYSMIIGYRKSFGRRPELQKNNIEKAFKALVDGGIHVDRLVYTKKQGELGFFVQTHISFDEVVKAKYTFQTLMYECLLGQPTAYCCTAKPGNEEALHRIVTFFVNNMVSNCVDQLNRFKDFTENDRKVLKKCTLSFIKQNISGKCVWCSGPGGLGGRTTRFFVSNCLDQSVALANGLGKLKDPTNVEKPGWVMIWTESEIKGLSINSLEKVRKAGPIQPCLNPSLSTASLCSDTEKPLNLSTKEQVEEPPVKVPKLESTYYEGERPG